MRHFIRKCLLKIGNNIDNFTIQKYIEPSKCKYLLRTVSLSHCFIAKLMRFWEPLKSNMDFSLLVLFLLSLFVNIFHHITELSCLCWNWAVLYSHSQVSTSTSTTTTNVRRYYNLTTHIMCLALLNKRNLMQYKNIQH